MYIVWILFSITSILKASIKINILRTQFKFVNYNKIKKFGILSIYAYIFGKNYVKMTIPLKKHHTTIPSQSYVHVDE